MKDSHEWAHYFRNNLATHYDIEQIQKEAIESYKGQYHNPNNAARAEKIKRLMNGSGRSPLNA